MNLTMVALVPEVEKASGATLLSSVNMLFEFRHNLSRLNPLFITIARLIRNKTRSSHSVVHRKIRPL